MPLGRWIRWWWSALTELVQERGAARALPAPAVPIEELRVADAAARCIACGACDRAFDAWADAPRDRFFGPMTFVLRARSRGEWKNLGPMVGAMARGQLGELEVVCPTRVPFAALVTAVTAHVPPRAPTPRTKRKVQHDPG